MNCITRDDYYKLYKRLRGTIKIDSVVINILNEVDDLVPKVSVKNKILDTNKEWGVETTIVNTDKYCGKLSHVNAGSAGSLHYHKIKDETLYLKEGFVIIELDDAVSLLNPGDSVNIKAGSKHRFTALTNSIIFEFSTNHNDKDVVRLEKSEDGLE